MKFKSLLFAIAVILAAFSSCKKVENQIDIDVEKIEKFLKANNIQAQKANKYVYYVEFVEGEGEKPTTSDKVAIKYVMRSISDTTVIIDQSLDKAITFDLYGLVPGAQVGIATMKTGGKSRIFIPSTMGYGAQPMNGEEYANLMFDVELCEIKH